MVTLGVSCKSIQHDSSNRMIQLTKKRCLGKCPVYDVFISKGGFLQYNGIDHVEKKGKYEFKVSDEDLLVLQQLFSDVGFEELESSKRKGRDFPVTVLSYHHKIVSFQGLSMPKKIKEIIRKIEEMIKI